MCRWAVAIFAILYLAALALLAIGTYGLFGQPRDPLAAVFLVPLGLPWILFLPTLPGVWTAVLGCAAPALNLLLLRGLCRAIAGRRR